MTMLRQLRRRLQTKSKIALFFMILISFLLQCTLLHVISIGSITPVSYTHLQGLGYKEILAYLDGEYPLEEAVRILKRDTRHFAKRQLTWFRREKDTDVYKRQVE